MGGRIPEATVARLPLYLRGLVELADAKVGTVSSDQLADMVGVNAAKVRKDLSFLGSYGTRGVGYNVESLVFEISRELGLSNDSPVVIVGLGNLGQALVNYRGFGSRGFRVVGVIDTDPAKVGTAINGLKIQDLEALTSVVRKHAVKIGVVAVPATAAQNVADRLVNAGVESILNFAPAALTVPGHVTVRKVDLSLELQILSYYQQQRRDGENDDNAMAAS